VQVWGVVAQW